MDEENDWTNLGPCCACGRPNDRSVRYLVMLGFEAPEGFNGWCCVVCGIPPRGAQAVICEGCIAAGNVEPRWIMGGVYATDGVRVPLDGYERVPFTHNLALHPERVEFVVGDVDELLEARDVVLHPDTH